jgi:hypothetical protein
MATSKESAVNLLIKLKLFFLKTPTINNTIREIPIKSSG